MSDVWASWNINYRDVVILDQQNAYVGTINLTTNGLQVPENYDLLRQTLIEVALVPEPGSLMLLAIGTTGLIARVRRRRTT